LGHSAKYIVGGAETDTDENTTMGTLPIMARERRDSLFSRKGKSMSRAIHVDHDTVTLLGTTYTHAQCEHECTGVLEADFEPYG
jgi:hypothetical protein